MKTRQTGDHNNSDTLRKSYFKALSYRNITIIITVIMLQEQFYTAM